MPSNSRLAALAVGVSDAPQLPFLAGALNGARAFHHWAEAMGYESKLLTDVENPVTIAGLRAALEQLLAAGRSGTHRFVIYFAGHGVIREVEEGLWLLSDWRQELRAVAVEALRRRLTLYQIDQVSIFADACRSLPPDIDTADLVPDAVLGSGPGPRSATMAVDKFVAAQDGAETFMIPGANPDDDRCLFSGVLLEGLWGTKQDAFSKILHDKVTSRSLGTYLETEVPRIAQTYRYEVVPSVSPTFPEGDDIYFGDGPKVTPPAFAPWPPLATLSEMGVRARRYIDLPVIALPVPEAPSAGEPTEARTLEDQLRTQDRPTHFETGSGFAIEGDLVVAIWTPPDVTAERDLGGPGWWRVRPANAQWLDRPAAVLIEFASGNFAAVTVLPEFIGSLVVKERGVAGLVYREIYGGPEVATTTERAIGELERGGLRADATADMAVELRREKHADPVRGVISAYLYDSIGDVESVRRMAYFYLQHDQPIPYDIALLAQLDGELREGRLLWTTVPAVPARQPLTEAERAVEWSYQATREVSGPVGGLSPWLRQGWAFLDDPAADGHTLVLPAVAEAAARLTPARFATLDATGGHQLAELLRLEPRR
jgi:Caspase domain